MKTVLVHASWAEAFCPTCKARNFIPLGHLDDVTEPDVDGFRCHGCGETVVWDVQDIEDDDLYIVGGLEKPRAAVGLGGNTLEHTG